MNDVDGTSSTGNEEEWVDILGASWLKREGKEAGNWYSPEGSLCRSSVYERRVIVFLEIEGEVQQG